MRPDDWINMAACRGKDVNIWFPPANRGCRHDVYAHAKAICRTCPVRRQCLDYALRNGIKDGIWGGLHPLERRVLKRLKRQREQHT